MRGALIALVCTGAFLFASVASAQDPYHDFRVPEARSLTWAVNGAAFWRGDEDEFSGFRRDTRSARGALSTFLRRHAESEPRISDLFFIASGTLSKNENSDSNDLGGFLTAEDFEGDADSYDVLGRVSGTRYLGASGWGLDAELEASYSYTRLGFGSGQRQVFAGQDSRSRNDLQDHEYLGSAAATLGAGYGRVRDVTGVFDMQVLEERLEETGHLRHPLSPAARQRLAELFSVSGDFQAAHDRPDRYLWREVERLLREDDAIEAGTFDAWSLMRALEPATLSIVITRNAGWRLTGAYQAVVNRGHFDLDRQSSFATIINGVPVGASESVSSSRRSLDEQVGFAVVNAAWHRPFGMRWQADFSGLGRYGDGPRRQVQGSGTLGLTWVIADRWVSTFSAFEVASSEVANDVRSRTAWTVRGSAQLSYFLEDSWSLTGGFDHVQARPLFNDGINPTTARGYMRQTQVVLGLTYRPVGRFEAPSLHVSERLTPGGI